MIYLLVPTAAAWETCMNSGYTSFVDPRNAYVTSILGGYNGTDAWAEWNAGHTCRDWAPVTRSLTTFPSMPLALTSSMYALVVFVLSSLTIYFRNLNIS